MAPALARARRERSNPQAHATAPDIAMLDALRVSFASAIRDNDAQNASAVYAEDARLLPPSLGVVHGRAKIGDFWQAGLNSGMSEAVFEPYELKHGGELAFEIGRYRLR